MKILNTLQCLNCIFKFNLSFKQMFLRVFPQAIPQMLIAYIWHSFLKSIKRSYPPFQFWRLSTFGGKVLAILFLLTFSSEIVPQTQHQRDFRNVLLKGKVKLNKIFLYLRKTVIEREKKFIQLFCIWRW